MPVPDLASFPVLVTGGAGFIGSHLADELVRLGARVRVLDDFSTGSRDNLAQLAGSIELLEGDLRDPETCRRSARRSDTGPRSSYGRGWSGPPAPSAAPPADPRACMAAVRGGAKARNESSET